MKKILLTSALALATVTGASADHMGHTGFYVGLHGGYATGEFESTFIDNNNPPVFLARTASGTDGALGGIHLGYDHQVMEMFVIGLEGMFDIGADKHENADGTLGTTNTDEIKRKNSYGAAVRLGLAMDQWLPFLKLGWKNSKFEYSRPINPANFRIRKERSNAFVVGLGIDYNMNGIMIGAGYEANFYKKEKLLPVSTAAPQGVNDLGVNSTFRPRIHEFKIRLGYKF